MQTVRQEGGRPGRRLVRRTGAIVPGGRQERNGIGRIAAVALVVPGPVEIDRRLILIAVTDRTIDHLRPMPILNAELLDHHERWITLRSPRRWGAKCRGSTRVVL